MLKLKLIREDSKYLNELNQCLEFFETCALKITNLFRLTQVFYQTPDIYMNNVDPNSIVNNFFSFLLNSLALISFLPKGKSRLYAIFRAHLAQV
jgi:hypothetical protein